MVHIHWPGLRGYKNRDQRKVSHRKMSFFEYELTDLDVSIKYEDLRIMSILPTFDFLPSFPSTNSR